MLSFLKRTLLLAQPIVTAEAVPVETLVYNGTFDVSPGGWTLSTAGKAVISGGKLTYDNPIDQFANSNVYVSSILPNTKYRLKSDPLIANMFIGLKQYNSGTYLASDTICMGPDNLVEITTLANCNRLMVYAGVNKTGQYTFDNVKLYKVT